MKDALSYFKIANAFNTADPATYPAKISVRLITNFTDGPLQKILTGVCLDAGIYPTLMLAPYKQYHLFLKNAQAPEADITFIFFDIHNYMHSAFHADEAHFEEVLDDLEAFCARQSQAVVMSTFPLPFESVYGNFFAESPLFKRIEEANTKLRSLAAHVPNLYLCNTARVLSRFGELQARDFRGMYTVDIPFGNDFFVSLAHEWLGFINARLSRTKKCLVLDLDNTLWGGILGEVGALGIELGPDYPGLAYQSFQRALLEFYNRGIILAINSRNNQSDVYEVFATNPHMILRPEHFAAMRINWNNKAENIIELEQELNIGTDALVFIDDDAMNRDLVRTRLPEVSVPEWNLPPEEYVSALLSLKEFYQLQLTDEDRKKGEMYAQERQRKMVHESAQNIDDYIAALGITITISVNDRSLIPRISQMTMKTNQFNITTKRYSEKEISQLMEDAWVITADVADKFGAYGTTILAIVTPHGNRAVLDTYLMSCRVLGRGVEQTFMDSVIGKLKEREIEEITAEFIPTAKNMPAKDFLPSVGFSKTEESSYTLSIKAGKKAPNRGIVTVWKN